MLFHFLWLCSFSLKQLVRNCVSHLRLYKLYKQKYDRYYVISDFLHWMKLFRVMNQLTNFTEKFKNDKKKRVLKAVQSILCGLLFSLITVVKASWTKKLLTSKRLSAFPSIWTWFERTPRCPYLVLSDRYFTKLRMYADSFSVLVKATEKSLIYPSLITHV